MIILLNGTSSAGKTTLAKIMQEKYREVLLLYGVDNMVQTAFPAKCDDAPFDQQAIRVEASQRDGQQHLKLIVSPYMYPIYAAAVKFYKILSEQGYHVIVDEVLFDQNRITPYFKLLSGEPVYFIGVKPEKEVVVRRENERGDRLPGLAAGLYDEVYHPLFTYDMLLDTGTLTPEESADRVLEYIDNNPTPSGFSISAQQWFEQYPD